MTREPTPQHPAGAPDDFPTDAAEKKRMIVCGSQQFPGALFR